MHSWAYSLVPPVKGHGTDAEGTHSPRLEPAPRCGAWPSSARPLSRLLRRRYPGELLVQAQGSQCEGPTYRVRGMWCVVIRLPRRAATPAIHTTISNHAPRTIIAAPPRDTGAVPHSDP